MAWYESKKLWSSLMVILIIIGTFVAVLWGSADDLAEVFPFLGSIVGGGAAGYAIGKKSGTPKDK